jgi:selenium metabolism protein YedF
MGLDNNFLLLLKSSGLGEGEPDLSEKLMKSFLAMLLESGSLPSKIICMNSGIFLTTDCSPVSDLLNKFVDAGCEILSCGTCLDYYGRKEKLIIGNPTNMKDTITALLSFKKVISI